MLRGGRLDEADIANILEEIESLGRTQVAELRSRLTVLVQHLRGLSARKGQPWLGGDDRRPTPSVHTAHERNPSLKPRTSETFAEAYADARKVASTETGIPLKAFPDSSPFTYAEAMDEAFWLGRLLDDRA